MSSGVGTRADAPRGLPSATTPPSEGRSAPLLRALAVPRCAWPLLALLAVAAAVRFSTLDLQSFWYDEAYTPVHVLHSGLGATLRSMVHSENTPPLWYILIWLWSRVFGTGVVALRSLSALAGVGTVAVCWALGRELGGRRTAIVLSAIVAVNPLFVWYSQEARAYALFALLSALSLLWFSRAWRDPRPRTLAAWSVWSVLALLTHYFAAFLAGPEAILLASALGPSLRRRMVSLRPTGASGTPAAAGAPATVGPPAASGWPLAVGLAIGALAVCALALLPLIVAQGGHGTQWIGRWALSDRLVAIPGYYLLGGQSAAFGHGLLVLCAVPVVLSVGLLGRLSSDERRAGGLVLGLGLLSIAIPLALVGVGADYLAPRNVIESWIPLSAALAVLLAAKRAGVMGLLIAALVCVAGAGIVLVTDLTPRYQRGDWSGVARVLGTGTRPRAVVTVELGAAPLEYYRPDLSYLSPGDTVAVSEVDLVGYAPVEPDAMTPPTPAFHFARRSSVNGLLVYRFVASRPQVLSERQLRERRLTSGATEVLLSLARSPARTR
jgi:mannosyltransferase